MSLFLSPIGNSQQFDANGNPLVGGQLFTYLAGSTTPAATYTDSTGATPQANPIALNSLGVPASPIWLTGGVSYKLVIKDVNNVTLRTVDNVSGVNDAAVSNSEWVDSGFVPSFISATSFSVPGDQTDKLLVGRRLKMHNTSGFTYGRILTSAFAASITTVTVTNDSTVLDSGLSSIAYGLLAPTNKSIPYVTGQLLNERVLSAGTYTPTVGTNAVEVELVGGGGAGGGAAATGAGQIAAGGGGGAGGYARSYLTSGFSGVTVTIGAAGAGASGAAGGNGGTTSFGAVLSATGGGGGNLGSVVAVGTVTFVGGGFGGSGASGNLVNSTGAPGKYSLYGTNAALSGEGASSAFGGGAVVVSGPSAGIAATTKGAGGSGGALTASQGAAAGGNGAAGICIIREYA